jgi:hypothetical protein
LKPLEVLAEIEAINDRIREAGRERLELVERFNRELRDLVRDFEDTDDTFRVYLDLTKRLERIARRVEKAHIEDSFDYTERFDKALTALKKRRFDAATKELDRIAVLGILSEQRRLFDEYKKSYTGLRARWKDIETQIRMKSAYYGSLEKVDVSLVDEFVVLRERIAAYNDGASRLLETFFKTARLQDSLKTSLDASYHPELGFPRPQNYENADKLLSFVINEGLGSVLLNQFLGYVKFSDNKLSHFIRDPPIFRQILEPNIVWLEALNDVTRQGTLKISIDEAGVSLAAKIPRIIGFLSKLSAPTDLLTVLREVQKLVSSGNYEKIRAAGLIEREHLKAVRQGAHIDELKSLRDTRAILAEMLKELPEPRVVERELA